MKTRIFILTGIFFFSFISLSSSSLAWWNSNWQYRKPITIDNTANSNTLTDYQVLVNLDTQSLISAGKMRSDCGDIRFTDSDDTTQLNYWLESGCNTINTKIWVKVPSIPASSTKTIYLYYGNPEATSQSNGRNTFIVFDDFESGLDTNYWNVSYYTGNTISVENGELGLRCYPHSYCLIYKVIPSSNNLILEFRWKVSSVDGAVIGASWGPRGVFWFNAYDWAGSPWTGTSKLGLNWVKSGSEGGGNIGPAVINEWYNVRLIYNGTNLTYGYAKNSTMSYTLLNTTSHSEWTSANAVVIGKGYEASGYTNPYLQNTYSSLGTLPSAKNIWFDDVKVRKYTSPEPTHSVGAEETPNQPPQYSNITVSPSSPQTYGISNIWFNISWQDDDGVDKAWIVHNFSGSSQTYLMNNDTTTHFYYLLNFVPSAGTYSYQFYANDTQGATNQTQVFTYIINKAETTTHLAINGTEDNVAFTYPAVTNASAWKTVANGNLSLYRNETLVATSSQNEIEELIQLSAGVYNYTATLEHQNYTASPVTRFLTINKSNSELTLTSSAGWTLNANTPTTITCTAVSPLTVSLYKDGVLVPNPYSVTPSFGIYNYTCVISDTQNYTPATTTNFLIVQTAGLGCTDNETYAFLLNITPNSFPFTLNFTDLVNNKYVKSDLSDVWINRSNFSISKDFTNGYYIKITNTTPSSSVEVKFGNYFASNSIPTEARAGTVYPVSNYEEISPYYVFNLVDEYNGSSLLPSSANTTLITFCNLGATNIPIKNTTFLVATKTKLDSVRFLVVYSATEIYYRDYQIRSNTEYKNIYLVDANKNQVVQMIINMIDNTGNFGNSLFKIKKYLGGNLETMTENYFDAENKVIIYLMNGFTYQIYVDNGEEERNIGNFFVDAVDLTKTIIINPITTTNFTQGNISYYLRMENGAIIFDYYDYSGETYNTSMYVYNASNNELLYFTSSDNRSIVSFIYIVPDPNGTYDVRIKIDQGFYGNHSWDFWAKFGALTGALAVPTLLPSLIGPNIMTGISVVGIISVPLFFGASHAGLAALIVVAFAGLFAYWGWYNVSVIVIVVAAVVAVLNKLREGKRE